VSLDFRVVPEAQFDPEFSHPLGTGRFKLGEFYQLL
jgi:hypothetical protein